MFFFPRGKGPLVSVLIPTRGRPGYLRRAVDSCHSLARDKSLLEYVFKIDDDDKETIEVADELGKIIPVRKVISPRGRGYPDMHLFVDQMAAAATGDWLFLFNDDALMQTQDWDQLILTVGTGRTWAGMNDLVLLLIPTLKRPFVEEFFVLRRRVYEILGHVSLSPHNDTWIYGIMRFLDMTLTMPMYIDHQSDIINDKTRVESEAAYKYTIKTITSPEALQRRVDDLQTLINYQKKLISEQQWYDKPQKNEGNWHYWKDTSAAAKSKDKDPEHVLVVQDRAVFFDKGQPVRVEECSKLGGLWCLRS